MTLVAPNWVGKVITHSNSRNPLKSFQDSSGQEWHLAAELPLEADLTPVLAYLLQQGVYHRITEEHGQQLVWVAAVEAVEPLAAFIKRWQSGEINIVAESSNELPRQHTSASSVLVQFLQFPLTSVLLLGGLFGFFAVEFSDRLPFYTWLRFVSDSNLWISPQLSFTLPWSEPWRFWTPMFIHYGLFHIVGNAIFIWYLGIRLERLLGFLPFLLMVLLIGAGSNIGQFAWEPNPNFGGLSGVNYGFMGYILVRQQLAPHPLLDIPKGILIISLAMLVLGVFGMVDLFIDGGIANAAHVSGLLIGVSLGFFAKNKTPTLSE